MSSIVIIPQAIKAANAIVLKLAMKSGYHHYRRVRSYDKDWKLRTMDVLHLGIR